jgi:hypothetical protein
MSLPSLFLPPSPNNKAPLKMGNIYLPPARTSFQEVSTNAITCTRFLSPNIKTPVGTKLLRILTTTKSSSTILP